MLCDNDAAVGQKIFAADHFNRLFQKLSMIRRIKQKHIYRLPDPVQYLGIIALNDFRTVLRSAESNILADYPYAGARVITEPAFA